jgi:hypothetical protein
MELFWKQVHLLLGKKLMKEQLSKESYTPVNGHNMTAQVEQKVHKKQINIKTKKTMKTTPKE